MLISWTTVVGLRDLQLHLIDTTPLVSSDSSVVHSLADHLSSDPFVIQVYFYSSELELNYIATFLFISISLSGLLLAMFVISISFT